MSNQLAQQLILGPDTLSPVGRPQRPPPGADRPQYHHDEPPTGPPVVVPRPDRPLPDGGFPPCKVQGDNFCVLTNDYPADFVGKMVEKSFKKIKIMYEELQTVGDPELFPNHLGTSSAARGAFACETDANTMRPGWAKDAISGEWMVVINTDVFPQKVRTESCKKPDQPCSFIAPFYESTCQQRYSLHRLLALHPWNPERSPQVTLFKFPAGCSCRVDVRGANAQEQQLSYRK
ncbi:protein spaetzle-like [Ixodes scapularis]|uniref:protein spaetzle-like n=1 Tax=Ixodes scapularis TaxID=6945 RepID=UPI001A9D365D|nr:protein spaetzle-like [Ixodes scapularis]